MKIRFYIRDMIWLTLLVACNLGWYVHKVAPTRMLEGQLEIGNRLIKTLKEQMDAERALAHKDHERCGIALWQLEELKESYRTLSTAYATIKEGSKSDEVKLRTENANLLEGNYNLLKQMESLQQELARRSEVGAK